MTALNTDLINHLSNVIRRVDGSNTMGAGALAEEIVAALGALAVDDEVLNRAAEALRTDGWWTLLSDDDLRGISRTVLRSLAEG